MAYEKPEQKSKNFSKHEQWDSGVESVLLLPMAPLMMLTTAISSFFED